MRRGIATRWRRALSVLQRLLKHWRTTRSRRSATLQDLRKSRCFVMAGHARAVAKPPPPSASADLPSPAEAGFAQAGAAALTRRRKQPWLRRLEALLRVGDRRVQMMFFNSLSRSKLAGVNLFQPLLPHKEIGLCTSLHQPQPVVVRSLKITLPAVEGGVT
jgi:hypothetical protein